MRKMLLLCICLSVVFSKFCIAGEDNEPVGMATDAPDAPPLWESVTKPLASASGDVVKELEALNRSLYRLGRMGTVSTDKPSSSPSAKPGGNRDDFLAQIRAGKKLNKVPSSRASGNTEPSASIPKAPMSMQEEMKQRLARPGAVKAQLKPASGSPASTPEPKKETELDRRLRKIRERN